MAMFRAFADKTMRHAFLSLLAALVLTDLASAQSWPSRPVRMIVPQAAGGMADIVVRVISSPLARELGQQVLVDNRAGDAGAQAAARAAADGYTYLFAPASVLAINPYMAKILPYSPEDARKIVVRAVGKDLRHVRIDGEH